MLSNDVAQTAGDSYAIHKPKKSLNYLVVVIKQRQKRSYIAIVFPLQFS